MKKFKYGDILCFKPNSLIGHLIVIVDSKGLGNYSHNAVFLRYQNGVPLFIESHESNKRGVAIQQLREEWNNYDVYRSNLKPRPVKELLKLLGNKYDGKRLWKIVKFRFFGIKIDSDDSNELICSELVNYAFNYKLLPAGYSTPYEIEKLALNGVLQKVN